MTSKHNHEEILRLLKEGEFGSEIAKKLGINKVVVRRVADKHGISYNPKPRGFVSPKLIDEMLRMRNEEKLSNKEISNELGISLSTVCSHIGAQPWVKRKGHLLMQTRGKETLNDYVLYALDGFGDRISEKDRQTIYEEIEEKLPFVDGVLTLGRSYEGFAYAMIYLSSVCMTETPPLQFNEVNEKTKHNIWNYCKLLREHGTYPNTCRVTPEMILFYKKEDIQNLIRTLIRNENADDVEDITNKIYKHAVSMSKDEKLGKTFMGCNPYNLTYAYIMYSFKAMKIRPYSWSTIFTYDKELPDTATTYALMKKIDEYFYPEKPNPKPQIKQKEEKLDNEKPPSTPKEKTYSRHYKWRTMDVPNIISEFIKKNEELKNRRKSGVN